MKIGIVWLPNVGKSTLFNALTKSYAADAANFPFCTIEPNVGVVEVKDQRLTTLAELSKTQKLIYATINFVDIAWLVKWAHDGQWLGNKFLSHIREVDAIVQVVRHFDEGDIIHVEWTVDPVRDAEIIGTELIFSDLEQCESKLALLEKKAKLKDTQAEKLFPLMKAIVDWLKKGKMIHDLIHDWTHEQKTLIKPYNFLTAKPLLYALNISQHQLCNSQTIKEEFEQKLGKKVIIVCAKMESEMMEFTSEERAEFLNDIQLGTHHPLPTLDDLIKAAFDELGLIYYFTTGEKETRAWTIPKWSTAPQAAGAIHTDFEKWFIKAEVVHYTDFVEAGSRSKAREMGTLRLEGKEYIVQDGDVITFRFNV